MEAISEHEVVIRTRGLSKQTVTQAVSDEMHRIAKACRGQITPESVLRNAEPENSPLHKCFEWDDTQAGAKFRYIQAAMLIRSVKVLVETHPQAKPQMVRAFVSVTTPESKRGDRDNEDVRCYVPLEAALKTPDYRGQMLEDAFRELRSFQRKYCVLKELADVFAAIDGLAIAV